MMRKKSFKAGCVLLILTLFFCQFGQLEVKAKSTKSENVLKQEWAEPSSKYFYQTVPIQKGCFYSIKDFIKIAGISVMAGTSFSSAQLLNKIKKKKAKFTMSGSGLIIRNQSFKANRTGEYRLNVKIENEWHVFLLHVVERYYKVQAGEVSRVTISQKEIGKTTTMEFTDPNIVNEISDKLSQAKYTFAFPKTLRLRAGFGGYYVSLYTADGSCINHLAVVMDQIWDTEVAGSMRIGWRSDSHFAKEFVDYIDKAYKEALSRVPGKLRQMEVYS